MKKFYLTSLAALLLVSCGNTQHKSSNEEVEDSVSLNIEVPESKSIGAPDKPCGEDARMLTQNCR